MSNPNQEMVKSLQAAIDEGKIRVFEDSRLKLCIIMLALNLECFSNKFNKDYIEKFVGNSVSEKQYTDEIQTMISEGFLYKFGPNLRATKQLLNAVLDNLKTARDK